MDNRFDRHAGAVISPIWYGWLAYLLLKGRAAA